ncbi:MAG: pseudaminic acid cytidylyltransferase [Vampirovibrio sp.]|nr:pseudaminic acid cytidylyltransferase [Vampirovibrio sp.]
MSSNNASSQTPKNALALITARGGSKRIPRKNVRPFLGKPMIAYTIEAAIASGCFDTVMVSTDDAEIAEVAKDFGAEVPFLRSDTTANDTAVLSDVVEEVLAAYEGHGISYRYLCCLLSTAPFLTGARLKQGMKTLVKNKADCVMPVVRFSYPIQRALHVDDGKISMVQPEHLNSMSNDLKPAYHDCGQFYWLDTQRFGEQKKLFMDNTHAMELPESEVQDIDHEEDWKIAEMKYRMLRASCSDPMYDLEIMDPVSLIV